MPVIDEHNRPFWEATLRNELLMQACGSCGRLRFPPRPMCPHCQSLDAGWQPMSGRGEIWSFVIAHPPLLPEFAELAPYNVVVVALEEDASLRLTGNLVAGKDGPINELSPEIGMKVRAVFPVVADGVALPRWTPDRT